jgi:cephalosporin-C deacetylase-like acetyl esterase
MPSRRRFIQSNILGLGLSLAGRAGFAGVRPSATEDNQPPDEQERDYWNDWPRYIAARMNEARARRLAELAAMQTEAAVRSRIEKIRSTVWRLIGGPLEKTPLKPRIVGTIKRGAYRIEKVIFESQPEVFVTANLYIPNQHQPSYPGILHTLGHGEEGKAFYTYQYVSQTLARKGYMVLVFDPFGQGERQQYLDPHTGQSLYGPTGEHDQAGRPMLLFGSQFSQYRVWDGIRALDYLLSRPEVDPERIGCTGQSGGGTMTMYLAALEPRIKVAVESDGNSENVAGPSYDAPGAVDDAEQNMVGSLPEGIDRGDLLLAFAPKPLLILYSRSDAGLTYSPAYVKGTEEIYQEVQAAYKLMGATEKVSLFGSPLPHNYGFFNRREAYRWFNRWLGREEWGTEEAEFDKSVPGELNCTSTGQVLTSLGGRSVVTLNTGRLRTLAPVNSPGAGPADVKAFRRRAQGTLRELLALPNRKIPLNSRILSSNIWQNDIAIDEFTLDSEPFVRVTGWFLRPAKGDSPFPTILYVSEGNRNEIAHEPSEMSGLVRKGFAVCAIDLRGLGLSMPRYPAAGPIYYQGGPWQRYSWACFTLGKPVLGQRVWDFLRCLDYLQSRREVDQRRIYGLGEKGAALAVLLSGVLDDCLHSIMLDSPLAPYRSVVESEAYSLDISWFLYGILKHFDTPELVGSLAPRSCWFLNAADAQGKTLAESDAASLYKTSIAMFKQSDAGEKIQFMVYPEHEKMNAYSSWLQAT